jgi:hypothetical protein
LVGIGPSITEALIGLERTREVFNEKQENEFPGRTESLKRIDGKVAFENVSFGDEINRPVLRTGVLLSELFDTRLRYSGISFGYQMGGLLAAPAPLICTALVHWAGGASWPVATYLAAIAFLTFIAVSFASRRERVAIIA